MHMPIKKKFSSINYLQILLVQALKNEKLSIDKIGNMYLNPNICSSNMGKQN